MASYTAIADVGETLVELLRDEMEDLVERDEVALTSPDSIPPGKNIRLTVFLYEVSENAHARNNEPPMVDETTEAGHPLVLDLRYLLTAHPAKTDRGNGRGGTSATAEQHSVLGRAMQALHDHSLVTGSRLEGSLDGELQLSVEPESTGAAMDIWSTFENEPFQPSVGYLVTPVVIESTQEHDVTRVVERTVEAYSWRQESEDE